MKKMNFTEFFNVLFGYMLLKTTGLQTSYVKNIIREKKRLRKEQNEKYQQMLDAHHAEYRGWTTENRDAATFDAVREVKLAQEIKRTQETYGKNKRY